ncbi:hypothetical protein GCM10027605_58980 [Micromonospora zhanjiangensis]
MSAQPDPELYPLALRLAGRRVLVVGGGAVATRRVPALLAAGATVEVVSPDLTPALRAHADAGRLRWTARGFRAEDLDGAWLAQVAVDDRMAAAAVSAAARERRIFCVRADDRAAATAWTPAVTRHGPVTVAVLGGGSPRRAVAVRDAVRALLDAKGALLSDPAPDGPVPARGAGRVALVGAGPGDPELITVKGRRLLAEADVVVADRLVPGCFWTSCVPRWNWSTPRRSRTGRPGPRRRSTGSWWTGRGPVRPWSGSRAATRTSSAGAGRSCWPARRPAYR